MIIILKKYIFGKFILLLIAVIFCTCEESNKREFKFPSDIEFIKKRNELIILSERTKQIAIVDGVNYHIKQKILLEKSPTGIALSVDEDFIYVTAGQNDGVIYILDSENKELVDEISVGHSPVSPLVGLDSKYLYVCNRFGHTISIIDLRKKAKIAEIAVPGEPVSTVLTNDGALLYVVNHLPNQPSNIVPVNSELTVIDIQKSEVLKNISFPNGSIGLKDIVMSPDGNYAYITHVIAHFELPTTRIENGWINANALSIFDVKNCKYQHTVLLDKVNEGSSNPWGIICTPDGNYLCVAHSGTDEISIIDRYALHEKLDFTSAKSVEKIISKDLNFLNGIQIKMKSGGVGPRQLVITDSSKLYVANYFSGNFGMLDFKQRQLKLSPLNIFNEYNLTTIEKGEMYFHSANICFQQWQSCASCHPDGRADGLNWDLLNDVVGNPKNTKSLLLSHKTPPVMSTGIRKNAEAAVRSGIHYILFTSQPEEVSVAIDEYLQSLEPVTSPFIYRNNQYDKIQKGENLFNNKEVGCFICHPKPYYTDLLMHDVGTHSNNDFVLNKNGDFISHKEFDTPSLIESWRTGPYIHDGRYKTIKEVITEGNHNNLRGNTSHLTDEEIENLVLYILTL